MQSDKVHDPGRDSLRPRATGTQGGHLPRCTPCPGQFVSEQWGLADRRGQENAVGIASREARSFRGAPPLPIPAPCHPASAGGRGCKHEPKALRAFCETSPGERIPGEARDPSKARGEAITAGGALGLALQPGDSPRLVHRQTTWSIEEMRVLSGDRSN